MHLRTRILRWALLAGLASALLGESAHAHSMNMFAYAEGGRIRGEVFARGGTPFIGAKITAYDPQGETLAETTTDDAGEFSLVPAKRCDWRLVAETDDGHRAEYTVPSTELSADVAENEGKPIEPSQPAPESGAAPPPPPTSESVASAPPADENADLSRQVAALRRELNQLRVELRWQDVIGGVGYILGLMGLTFYFLGVRKRDREAGGRKKSTS
ncbi:MAG: hypothetical protein GXX96_26090 [Planctomycetaceae bacterium]|nr:hypothetical protein [Planctomycetaceae bacterium]